MNQQLQKYLMAIEASDFSDDYKVYWKIKAIFIFDFIENGVNPTLNELETIYSTVENSKQFKKAIKNWQHSKPL